jgi:hypothetical protein
MGAMQYYQNGHLMPITKASEDGDADGHLSRFKFDIRQSRLATCHGTQRSRRR